MGRGRAKSNPARRVLSIGSPDDGVGVTTIFGHNFNTTGWLGWVDDGMGGKTARAFPGWITIPAYQDLADGRRFAAARRGQAKKACPTIALRTGR